MMASAVLAMSGFGASAQTNIWNVSKVSGEAWVMRSGVQSAAVSQQVDIRPGESIQTGRNGRVLLVRGAETLMVAPNSVIEVPAAGREGMTTIIQRAGSITLDVEKKNVQHFEVETPYLAAVVKGTQFRVSVNRGRSSVEVIRGQVQVADFRTGQQALVLPGQMARVAPAQGAGLRLQGSGALGRIEQGAPRPQRVSPVSVPASGLRPVAGAQPLSRDGAAGTEIRTRENKPRPALIDASAPRNPEMKLAKSQAGVVRVTAPIGEVKLDINKVTRGMARSEAGENRQVSGRQSVWSSGEINPGNAGNRAASGNSGVTTSAAAATSGQGAASAVAASASNGSSGSSASSATSAAGQASSNASANGQSNSANANSQASNGNGNNGNGNAFGKDKDKDDKGKDKSRGRGKS